MPELTKQAVLLGRAWFREALGVDESQVIWVLVNCSGLSWACVIVSLTPHKLRYYPSRWVLSDIRSPLTSAYMQSWLLRPTVVIPTYHPLPWCCALLTWWSRIMAILKSFFSRPCISLSPHLAFLPRRICPDPSHRSSAIQWAWAKRRSWIAGAQWLRYSPCWVLNYIAHSSSCVQPSGACILT